MSNRDFTVAVGFHSHTGRVRERNEDSLALYMPYRNEASVAAFDAIMLVADGMGGHEAGDAASRFVADRLIGALTDESVHPPDMGRTGEYMRALLRRVDRDLRSYVGSLGVGTAGSTATLAALHGTSLFVGHVGDSRLYRLRGDDFSQLTPDHSWVAEQVRAGLMSAAEAANHPRRNILTECLGIGKPPRVSVLKTDVHPGDRYMLCTDGLHGGVPDAVIAQILLDEAVPQDAVNRLITAANDAGGSDNTTVIVFDLVSSGLHATEPGARAVPHPGVVTAETLVPAAGNGGAATVVASDAAGMPEVKASDTRTDVAASKPSATESPLDPVASHDSGPPGDEDGPSDEHRPHDEDGPSDEHRHYDEYRPYDSQTRAGRTPQRLATAVFIAGLLVVLSGGALATWQYLEPGEHALERRISDEPPSDAELLDQLHGPTIPAPPLLRDTAQRTSDTRSDTAAGDRQPQSDERGDHQ
ncbi:hypothetical protein BH23GEM9_BH23GEM9_25980 [soil metagenome]